MDQSTGSYNLVPDRCVNETLFWLVSDNAYSNLIGFIDASSDQVVWLFLRWFIKSFTCSRQDHFRIVQYIQKSQLLYITRCLYSCFTLMIVAMILVYLWIKKIESAIKRARSPKSGISCTPPPVRTSVILNIYVAKKLYFPDYYYSRHQICDNLNTCDPRLQQIPFVQWDFTLRVLPFTPKNVVPYCLGCKDLLWHDSTPTPFRPSYHSLLSSPTAQKFCPRYSNRHLFASILFSCKHMNLFMTQSA